MLWGRGGMWCACRLALTSMHLAGLFFPISHILTESTPMYPNLWKPPAVCAYEKLAHKQAAHGILSFL